MIVSQCGVRHHEEEVTYCANISAKTYHSANPFQLIISGTDGFNSFDSRQKCQKSRDTATLRQIDNYTDNMTNPIKEN